MSFIGIDIGSSFIKGAVLNTARLRLEHVRRIPFPGPVAGLEPGLFEVNPQSVLAAFRAMASALARRAQKCEGLVISSQMHGLVLATSRGRALTNIITWRDNRALAPHRSGGGKTYFEELRQRLSDDDIRRTGSELRSALPLCALFTMAEQGQIPKGDCFAVGIPEFILAHETGAILASDATMAASQGCFDIETNSWHGGIIAKLGLDKVRWPPVCRTTPHLVCSLKIGGRNVPCYAGVGDQPCSLAGALLWPGELSINAATGAQVSMLSTAIEYGDYQIRPFLGADYLKIVTHIPAGRGLAVLASALSETTAGKGRVQWRRLLLAAEKSVDSDLRVDLAFSTGRRGSITNITESNFTAGSLMRSAMREMADKFFSCARRISPGEEWKRIVFSGGLLQKMPLLRRFVAEKFHVPWRSSPSPEDALNGLLVLALAAGAQADSVRGAIALLAEKTAACSGNVRANNLSEY